MKEQEILEGNKLIAIFVEMNKVSAATGQIFCENDKTKDLRYQFKNKLTFYNEGDLLFHSSWDWLMPVIEKINEKDEIIITLCPAVCIVEVGNGKKIEKTEEFCHSKSFKGLDKKQIDEVHKAVVFSIKWYNEQLSPRELEK